MHRRDVRFRMGIRAPQQLDACRVHNGITVGLHDLNGSLQFRVWLQDLFRRPIEDLAELSVRSRNSLQKETIRTLGDLVQKTEEEMLAIENFGKKSLKEIAEFLEEHALRFGMRLKEGDGGRLFFMDDDASDDDA